MYNYAYYFGENKHTEKNVIVVLTIFANARNSKRRIKYRLFEPLRKRYVVDVECTRCTHPRKIIIKDIKNIRRVHTYWSLREQTPFSVLWKSIFFGGISLPSTDITHIRVKHSLKRDLLKNALQRGKVDFSQGKGEKEKAIENETSRYLISRGTRMFPSIEVKCSSLLKVQGFFYHQFQKTEALNDSAEVDK